MERKPKFGISARLIVGLIYALLGVIFLTVGILLRLLTSGDEDSLIVGTVFVALGGVFFLVGALGLLLFEALHRRRVRRLLENNRYVWGEVVEVVPNLRVQINGRNPYIARVLFTDSRGTNHMFKSHDLRAYPGKGVIGKKVKVYFEDERYKLYYVDIDSVLPAVIEH